MKLITLKEAFDILLNCSAVITEDHHLGYPQVAPLTGEDDNEFAYVAWSDETGQDYSVMFAEGSNREVKVAKSSMFLTDVEGETCELFLLVPARLDDIFR